MLLGEVNRRRGIESGRAVLDGAKAVARNRVADAKRNARERLRAHPLYRIPVDPLNSCHETTTRFPLFLSQWTSSSWQTTTVGKADVDRKIQI